MDEIGVAIPTYNRNFYLTELLHSIPTTISVFVSDNGGYVNDSIKHEFKNATFTSSAEVVEMFDNWNIAASVAADAKSWCLIPSDDDIFLEGAFDTISFYIEKYPDADIIIFGHKIIDENGIISDGWVPAFEKKYLPKQGFGPFKYGVDARMPCILFKSTFLKEQLGFFDPHFKLTAADSDLVQRALIKGTAVYVPKIVGGYRVWAGALTHKRMATRQWLQEVDYWQNKIVSLLKESTYAGSIKHIKDEVYALNMLGGLKMLHSSGDLKDKVLFIIKNRFPWRATIKTKLRLIKKVLLR